MDHNKKQLRKKLAQQKKQAEEKFDTNLLNDLTFRKLFSSKETRHIVAHFLEDIAGIKAQNIKIEPTQIYNFQTFPDVKKEQDINRTQVDLLLELDGRQQVTIEMQRKYHTSFEERAVYYVCKVYINNYGKDNSKIKYSSLKPVAGLNILDFQMFNDENDPNRSEAIREFTIMEKIRPGITYTGRKTLEEIITLFFFQLPVESQNALIREWQSLFLTGKVSSDAPDYLKEAAAFIAYENLSKEERKMYQDVDKWNSIREAEIEYGEEQGEKRGWGKGHEEGLEEGREEGREEASKQIAQKLLKQNFPLEQISELTDLSMEELKALAKE